MCFRMNKNLSMGAQYEAEFCGVVKHTCISFQNSLVYFYF